MATLLPSDDYCLIPITDIVYCFIPFTKCSSIEFHLIHLILLNYYLVDNS